MNTNNNQLNHYSVFDFCQTLCSFETADAFIEFICTYENTKNKVRIERILNFLKKTKLDYFLNIVGGFFHTSFNKKIVLKKIKGLSKEKIDSYALKYYEQKIRPNLIIETLERLRLSQSKGNKIALVSASYYPFLIHFKKEFNIDLLVANHFLYKNGVFSGCLTSRDCVYKNKVKRFRESLINENYCVDESYGDSKNDIPILKIASKKFVISREKHKKWVNGYNEIIWSNPNII